MKPWGKKMKDSIIKVYISTGRNWKTTVKKPNKGKVVDYKMKGSDELKTGKIVITQPKSTGKYSH